MGSKVSDTISHSVKIGIEKIFGALNKLIEG